ncbi:MAG TPA: maleylacetate reductase [Burkholderiaceae bacterium]|nr:maleylacetate reductase [Burkholderiaceae bacterium]
MAPFEYESAAARVVFGAGCITRMAAEVALLGRRALVLCTPDQRALAERCCALLAEAAAGLCDQAVMHVPRATADAAVALARELHADVLVAVGGGSTIGLAKAIALEIGLPILALPTTYAGSEMTPVWGVTEAGVKRTGRERRVQPRTVLYDPDLTLTLPAALSVTSGINSMAHCIEGLYSPTANPLTSLMAEEGIRALAQSLPRIVRSPLDETARSDALYGAWLGGSVLGAVGMALHHKLCHTLGGSFNLPHAETHTIVIAHVVAYNAAAAPEAMRRVARALGDAAGDPAALLHALIASTGVPIALKDIGMPKASLEDVVHQATANPYANPAPLRADALRRLLRNAYEGRPPEAVLD